ILYTTVMQSFEDIGLCDELVRTLEDEEIETPTALQAAVVPALRRGGNLVARASTGSGKTLAYTLGVLDRLEAGSVDVEDIPLRVLILAPTPEVAERVALSILPYAAAVGLGVAATGGAWGTPATEADILVASPADVMESVRASGIKLDDLTAIVIDGAWAMHELGDWPAVDTLLDHLPRDTQRILISSTMNAEIDDLAERRIKRALRYPDEPAVQPAVAPPVVARVGYVAVAGQEKIDVLARQLSGGKGEIPPVLFCRTDERAADLAERLAHRGFLIGDVDDPEADAAVAPSGISRAELVSDSGEETGQTISFDVPADAVSLLARHQGDESAVVLLNSAELPHLREIARQANVALTAVPLPRDQGPASRKLRELRAELQRTLREDDLTAEMLVIEPLFEEFTAAEIAAATVAMLRRGRPEPNGAPSSSAVDESAAATTGPPPATWARLYVGIGSRDDVRPGDLVGAVAGEANIPGSHVGRVEIRDTFTIVEVQAGDADRVIRAVNGTTIKGRSVRVDYDRGGDRGRKTGAPPKRRMMRQPPKA
ncbi:MAG TPA: DEAD/DEAH box helicase, partial [Longimicrobiaceae bacterium]|nr:DEAD/DEAH box helicase [Longimicrobiaceae bacterium]